MRGDRDPNRGLRRGFDAVAARAMLAEIQT
jgi:hypothetical protein